MPHSTGCWKLGLFQYYIVLLSYVWCVETQLCTKFIGCDWIGGSSRWGSIIIWLAGETQCWSWGSFIWWDYEMWSPCQVSIFIIFLIFTRRKVCSFVFCVVAKEFLGPKQKMSVDRVLITFPLEVSFKEKRSD